MMIDQKGARLLSGGFLRDLGALFPRFGQSDGDCLFTVLHGMLTRLHVVHLRAYFLACLRTVFAPAGFSSAGFPAAGASAPGPARTLSCHAYTSYVSKRGQTALEVGVGRDFA